jgi:hypothetical protein
MSTSKSNLTTTTIPNGGENTKKYYHLKPTVDLMFGSCSTLFIMIIFCGTEA